MKRMMTLALFITLFSSACKSDKKDIMADGQTVVTEAAIAMGDTYSIDPAVSIIEWIGSKPGKDHSGTVPISAGSATVKEGVLTSGSFTIDFANLENTDLASGKGKEGLESHLKGLEDGKEDDFFNVRKYPTGKFEITKVANLESSVAANMLVYGNLTIKGKTAPVSFKAKFSPSGSGFMAQTDEFSIDRTKWGLNFMSNTAFDNLKDKFIDDKIMLTIKLKLSK